MAEPKTRSFGRIIRDRRRQLDLTQVEVAHLIDTSVAYVGHLEASRRHPSRKVVVKLSDALGLDARDLFLLANPKVGFLISEHQKSDGNSAWDAFNKDKKLRKIHKITDQEMGALSELAMMGVRGPRDFIFILNTIRQALGR
ncbi:MAG TPA: helix-turn-helix domain-containing protein [Candidatus Binataceae bacterium]|jgi:transcriptional regulator with XRE-family HTH domain|nr:helix-turn-helix domain-containing protein [Candidatus Binataceae bacterium]